MDYVVADNYLCFLALLEMILKEKGINISQYDLAEKVGVTVPEGYHTIIKNIRYSTTQNDYGVAITPYALQEVFNELKINIQVSYLDALHINEMALDSILYQRLSEDQYIIFAFSYGVLYNKETYYDLGHVSLLQEFISNDRIRIYDPGPNAPGIKDVRLSDMYDAMRRKGGIIFLG